MRWLKLLLNKTEDAMRLLRAEEAAYIDQEAPKAFKLPLELLMENAGHGLAVAIQQCYNDTLRKDVKTLFVIGTGNNGADGLVAARHLLEKGMSVKIWIIGDLSKCTALFHLQYQVLLTMYNNGLMTIIDKAESDDYTYLCKQYEKDINNYNLVVEGLIGTGLRGNLKESTLNWLQLLKKWRALNHNHKLIAIDVPAGIISNTGSISKEVPKFDYTVTFGAPKQGMFLYPGKEYCGEIITQPLGLPWVDLLEKFEPTHLVDKKIISHLLPKRSATAHKGTNGHALIVGGHAGMLGAPALASIGALKSGTGKVTVACPELYLGKIQQLIPLEVMTKCYNSADNLLSISTGMDAIGIGPGLGREDTTGILVRNFLLGYKDPIVLDADGLFALGVGKEAQNFLKQLNYQIILTPHVGEFKRLTGLSTNDIESNRIEVARNFAKMTKSILVLKGAPTVIANPIGEVFINSTGNSGMGTGGMGDVLTGIITALIAQGVEPFYAAILGVYLHGASADLLAETKVWGYTPSEVANSVGRIISRFTDK